MKKIILSIMALTALASCQKSEEQTPEMGGSKEVVFTSAISTRAAGTSWDDGDEIGVFMYETGLSDICDNSENVPYTTSGGESGSFTSTTPLIYPNYKVDFVAYYPYAADCSDSVITLNTADQTTEEKIKAQDFMVARAQQCDVDNHPALSFTRKMSKIVINVDRKDSEADAVLTDIFLKKIKVDGTFSISKSDDAKVVAGETTSNIALFFNETSSTIEAIIIPQEDMSANLMLSVDDKPSIATISGTFAENKRYNYNLIIGTDAINLTAGSISDWDSTVDNDDLNLDLDIDIPTYTLSEINENNVPTINTWVITDDAIGYTDGIQAALGVANNEGRDITIVFPNLTSLTDFIFYYCSYAFSIDIPQVKTIDKYAFEDAQIKTAKNTSNVESIGASAFRWTPITSFDFKSVKTIGDKAFLYSQLHTAENTSNLESVSCSVFFGTPLTSFDFSSVKTIDMGAFGSSQLQTAKNTSNVESIGSHAFTDTPITSFDFSSVKTISEGAFWMCEKLTAIELPSTLETIGASAFEDSGITTVTLNWTGDEILAYDTNWGINSSASITIPKGSTNDYEAKGWGVFNLVEKTE